MIDLGSGSGIQNFEEAIKILDQILERPAEEYEGYKTSQELKELRESFIKRIKITKETSANRIISKANLLAAEGKRREAIQLLKTVDKDTNSYQLALDYIDEYNRLEKLSN